jgi:predicted nucleic acid-binding protein
MDGFIAATAERHDFTLVTRNVADFESLGIRLENPWLSG